MIVSHQEFSNQMGEFVFPVYVSPDEVKQLWNHIRDGYEGGYREEFFGYTGDSKKQTAKERML